MVRPEYPAQYRSAIGEVDAKTDELYTRLDAATSHTWTMLHFAWHYRRPKETADIKALRATLALDACCDELLSTPNASLHPNTNFLRYELFAGAVVVRNIVPIPLDKRTELTERIEQYDFQEKQWLTPLPEEDATFIGGWRRWLRRDGDRRTSPDAELRGEPALLAAASYRMEHVLRARPVLLPPDPSLVLPIQREQWRHWHPTDEG